MSCGCEWWSSLRESASHGRLVILNYLRRLQPQMCYPPPKKRNKHQMFKPICLPPRKKKDKSKMNSYRSMFFSPYKKSPKNCEVLGPLIKHSPTKRSPIVMARNLVKIQQNRRLWGYHLIPTPDPRCQFQLLLWWMRHLMCSDMLRYFLMDITVVCSCNN